MYSLVELDVESLLCAWHEEVGVELLAYVLQKLEAFLESFLCTSHADVLPHDVSELLVYGVDRALALDVEDTVLLCVDCLLCLIKLWEVGRETWPYLLVGEIVLYGVWEDEVTVGETLHEG